MQACRQYRVGIRIATGPVRTPEYRSHHRPGRPCRCSQADHGLGQGPREIGVRSTGEQDVDLGSIRTRIGSRARRPPVGGSTVAIESSFPMWYVWNEKTFRGHGVSA